MVETLYAPIVGAATWVIGAQAEQPLILRLDPEDRVRVLAGLAAVIILGFALVLLAWWGARATRRYMNRPPRTRRHADSPVVKEDDWATKPLYPDTDSTSKEKA
jgi:hypothetical protein